MEKDEHYDMIFKIIIVGDASVGKSNILLQYLQKQFNSKSKSTVGVEFGHKLFMIDKYTIKAQIWDTAGQERYRAVTSTYYRGAHGSFVVYDISSQSSFDSVDKWVKDLREKGDEKAVIILIGNKSDLEEERVVTTAQGERKAKANGVAFFETSALSCVNIDEAFNEMMKDVYAAYHNELIALLEEANDKKANHSSTQNHSHTNGIDLNSTDKGNKRGISSCC